MGLTGLGKPWQLMRAGVPSSSLSIAVFTAPASARQAAAKPHPLTTSSITTAPTAKSHSSQPRSQVPDLQSNGDGMEAAEHNNGGGELGIDEDDEVLEAAWKDKQVAGGAKKVHKGGTKAMGINLKTADITAVKRDASAHCSAKLCYNNSHLPFKNQSCGLQTWRNAVIPGIIDWIGTLEEPFAANSHPDLQDVVESSWNEEYLLMMPCRLWPVLRFATGGAQLANTLYKPYKSSKNQRKEYVKMELRNLSYIYRDPETKSGAYRSASIIKVFSAHQQVINKTNTCYGYPAGALSLCAAAHERALKLWRTGNAPTKETKKSFVHIPWAIRTAAHYKVVSKLSKRVWNEIDQAATAAIGSVEVDAMADDSEIEDPEDLVQLSESGDEDV